MLVRRVPWSRLLLLVVLVTAVFALNTQKALPQTQSEIPRPVERENWPHLADNDSPQLPGQYVNAVDLVPFSKLVFQSLRDMNDWDIYTGNDNGSGQIALTNNNISDIHPRFNRGANRIVFARSNGTGDDYEIYSMNSDGSGLTQLTNNTTDDGNPYWSPDSSRIVFEAYRDGQPEIYVMNADGTGQTRLTYHSDFDGFPTWSPDGSKIAFTSRRNGAYRIYTMNIDGGNQIQRSNQPYSFHPVWSPDSSRIAFDADGNGDGWQEIWVVNADGSAEAHQFTPSDAQTDAWVRSWSPDGQHISFTQIHFIEYQGIWYWTSATNIAYHTPSNTINFLGSNDTDWNPDWQSLDAIIPTSKISSLPPTSPATFTVNWNGSDGGISGLKSYDIQIKVNNGPWQDLLTDTISTSIAQTGAAGTTYSFRSRARDKAGNVEAWPMSPDATTAIESFAPVSNVYTMPSHSPARGFLVVWSGLDPGDSGIEAYDVQYRKGSNGSWTNWQMGINGTAAHFGGGNPGDTFYFRVRATDYAGNIEVWPSGAGDTSTTLYAWAIRGNIADNTGAPIVQAHPVTNPSAAGNPPSGADGEYEAYVTAQASNYVVNWNKADYGNLPNTTIPVADSGSLDVVLPPANDLLQNGNFETGVWAPWSVIGNGTPVLTSTSHTGEAGVYMGRPFTLAPATTQFQDRLAAQIAVGADEIVHMVWEGYPTQGSFSDIYYAYKNHSGEWSSPQNISNNSGTSSSPQLVIGANNRISIVWVDRTPGNSEIFYSQQNNNGTWTTPKNLSQNDGEDVFPRIVVDKNNVRHIIWTRVHSSDYSVLWYVNSSNGTQWSSPYSITTSTDFGRVGPYSLLIDKHDELHLIWTLLLNSASSRGYYAHRVGTSWDVEKISDDAYDHIILSQAAIDQEDNIHVAWMRSYYAAEASAIQYQIKVHNSSWSIPETIMNSPHQFTNLALAVGPTGNTYVAWDLPDADVFMVQRDAYGSWSSVQDLSSIFSTAPQLAEDDLGNLHALWHIPSGGSSGYQMSYARRNESGSWSSPQVVSETSNGYWPFAQLLVSRGDNVHMIWQRKYLNQDYIDYRGSVLADEANSFALTQQVIIPLTITTPALSFLYQLGGVSSTGISALHIEVDNGSETTSILNLKAGTIGWEHSWADLSAWAGETVSITFRLNQVVNEPWVWAYLDEVTLGSAYPDLWVQINDSISSPGEQVALNLTYGNRSGTNSDNNVLTYTLPAEISFVSASVQPTAVNNSTLTWNLSTLPGQSSPFTIVVTGIVAPNTGTGTYLTSTAEIRTTAEIETFNNTAQGSTYIGRFLYIPSILNN
jgi:Tol biopolymer transport system component